MTTYRRTKEAPASIVSYSFDFYNQAVAFCKTSEGLSPSKPYKKGAKWVVSIVSPVKGQAQAERVEDWKKPFALYNEWRGYEGLEGLEPNILPGQIRQMLDKSLEDKLEPLKWAPLPKHVYEQAHRQRY
jgi:hypothetical protein